MMQTLNALATPHHTRRWSRFSGCSPQPVRLLHHGGVPSDEPWERQWCRWAAYGVDSGVTAAVRPLAAPLIGGRDGLAASEGQPVAMRAAAVATSGARGLGKGLAGAVVSLGVAGVCLFKGAGLGIGAGCYRLARKIGKQESQVDDRAARTRRARMR